MLKIGSKAIKIKTHDQVKVRVTAVVWIVTDGIILPPNFDFQK